VALLDYNQLSDSKIIMSIYDEIQKRNIILLISLSSCLSLLLLSPEGVFAKSSAQNPVPTVTPLDRGVIATVRAGMTDPVKVRSGPSTLYSEIGVLLIGQSVTAKGRSDGGLWLLIAYRECPVDRVGFMRLIWIWLLVNYLSLNHRQQLRRVTTATIDPTLAAQFIVTSIPTQLATFTPAPPLVIPTYAPQSDGQFLGGIPVGLVILTLAGLGLVLGAVSLLQIR